MNVLLVSQLLGELTAQKTDTPYSGADFEGRVNRLIERFRCQQRPFDYSDFDQLHRWIFRYALKMANVSYQRLLEPAPAPPTPLLEAFVAAVEPYPVASAEHFQGSVDPASSLRRAKEVQRLVQELASPQEILCMGDDDATSVGLAMLGCKAVTALDIDQRIIDWLNKAAEKAGVQVATCTHDLRELPDSFMGKFAAVVTDPTPDNALARMFMGAASKCLRSSGLLFWADHPDWNVHCMSHVEACGEYGLELFKVFENWHTYEATVYDDVTANHVGVDPQWLRRLASQIRVWSHLYVFRRVLV